MAINIDQVYKTVLVVLEQQKRGVITPVEFNKIAAQAQQEVFTQYFDELNQTLRLPQTSLAYADRMALLDEKISLFKVETTINAVNGSVVLSDSVQELGYVAYNDREAQRIQKIDLYTTNQSPLTAPTEYYPVYIYELNKITLYPSINGDIDVSYLKFPTNPKWGFTIDPNLGNYIYNPISSVDFEIHQSDQPLLIDKILGYAGVMTKDQFAMQLSMQKEQQINTDSQK
jgi:hypothetical protein